jgi:hypothetical protein
MFLEPLLQWKRNKYYIFCVCVGSLSCPACNAHAPYCHLWPVRLYNILPHYLINGQIFGGKKKLWNTKCVFWFPLQLLSETLLILRIRVKYPLLLSDFNEIWIFSTVLFFEKYSNIFHENLCSDSRAVPRGQTDGRTEERKEGRTDIHDEANSRFSQFCECA